MTNTLATYAAYRAEDGAEPALSSVSDRQIRVALSPLATVTSLVLEAVGRHRGSPSDWYSAVLAELQPDDVATLKPVFGGQLAAHIPDCLIPRPDSFAPAFETELERVVAVSADELVADIAADGLLDSPWVQVARAPRQWLFHYGAAMRRAWVGARPLWQRATPLLESEVSRVGTALARGSFDVLVDDIYPKGKVCDDRWFISCLDTPVSIDCGMVVAPIVGGSNATFLVHWDNVVRYVGYPLPRARRMLCEGERRVRDDALVALLGEPRSEILRRLDRSETPGLLASSLLFAPSAISHHLLALERAGLVQRERLGRNVLVHRTPRGTELVNLYDR